MSTKLRKEHRFATDKAADCHSHQFSVKICVSQSDGLQAVMITIFGTQVLDLGMIILVNVAVNSAMLSSSRKQKYADQRRKQCH